MKTYINSPELAYLSPTTRERAILIAQQLISSSQVAPADAIKLAILQAKNWAVKNVNRNVWKRLKQSDKELV
jgi:uncharacterized protein YdaT